MHFRTIVQPIEEPMATIKANGGAASVWERTRHHSDGMPYTLRVVLCRNGKVLTGIGPGAYHHAQRLSSRQPLDTQAHCGNSGLARRSRPRSGLSRLS